MKVIFSPQKGEVFAPRYKGQCQDCGAWIVCEKGETHYFIKRESEFVGITTRYVQCPECDNHVIMIPQTKGLHYPKAK